MLRFILSISIAALIIMPCLADPVSRPATFTRDELKNYFAIQQKLYPKKGDLFQKLIQKFGDRPTYTSYQVTAITDEKTKKPVEYHPEEIEERPSKVPVDAFTPDEVIRQLSEYEKSHPEIKKQFTYTNPKGEKVTVKSLQEALIRKFGPQPWYFARELRDVEENGIRPLEVEQGRLSNDPVEQALREAQKAKNASWAEFKSPEIRQNWRDVLYEDDPSQQPGSTKATTKDLVGATFSYVDDEKAGTQTWSSIGSIILPWQHNLADEMGLTPVRIAAAPSISVNRVDTNGDPKKEADSMLFRLGAYAEWMLSPSGLASLQSRAAFVYATDTGFNASLPGGEIDIEPRWQNKFLPIGFTRILLKKAPLLDDESDRSLLDYQLRLWIHTEGGDVQDNGKSWDPTNGTFLRLGPTAQLQVRAPKLAFGKDFSITALYSYLGAVSGSDRHHSFFKVSGVFDLVKDDILNHKLAITAEYQEGGLNFTKENVETFTLGLAVLY